MAQQKRTPTRRAAGPEHAPRVRALPFPGESPTVSLAMAAARMYGMPEEGKKPAEGAPKRRSATKKRPSKAGGKAKTSARRGRA